jgi:gas vesicle protein
MAYEYDRMEREEGGGSFLMGLLAGTVLGAGLGMLFAPKAGADTRRQLSEQATRLRSTANETYNQASEKFQQTYQQASDKLNQASEKVSQMVDRGREAYDRSRGTGAPSTPTTATGTTGFPSTAPSNRP